MQPPKLFLWHIHGSQPGVCKDPEPGSRFLVRSVQCKVVLSLHVGLAGRLSGGWLRKFLVYVKMLRKHVKSSASVRGEGRLGFPLEQAPW